MKADPNELANELPLPKRSSPVIVALIDILELCVLLIRPGEAESTDEGVKVEVEVDGTGRGFKLLVEEEAEVPVLALLRNSELLIVGF